MAACQGVLAPAHCLKRVLEGAARDSRHGRTEGFDRESHGGSILLSGQFEE
jgi:hypothetical protein